MINSLKPYSKYVRDAVSCIKQHIDVNPFVYKTVAGLLEHLSSPNRSSVEKAFKGMYGYGIKEYQVKQRLAAARMYLLEGLPIKAVASKCYYSSQSAFCRAFKKAYNMTPTEFINMQP